MAHTRIYYANGRVFHVKEDASYVDERFMFSDRFPFTEVGTGSTIYLLKDRILYWEEDADGEQGGR